VLIGKTTTNFNTDGFQAFSGGFVHATATQGTANSGTVITVNRKSTDGSIVDLKKDGTTVGSIGAYDGRPYLASTTVGIRVSNALFPSDTSGVITDGAMNIGGGAGRFKDLYLSGGVYLGGTGAANKLDDYEEGTWTPTIFGSSVAGAYTYGNGHAVYTKVGRQVTVSCVLTNVTTTTAGSGYLKIGGLPFTKVTNTMFHGAGRAEQWNFGTNNTSFVVSFISASPTNVLYFRGQESSGGGEDMSVTAITSGATDIELTITYFV
jgi:hypothetical protein